MVFDINIMEYVPKFAGFLKIMMKIIKLWQYYIIL